MFDNPCCRAAICYNMVNVYNNYVWVGVTTAEQFSNNLADLPGVMYVAALASTDPGPAEAPAELGWRFTTGLIAGGLGVVAHPQRVAAVRGHEQELP